jgi:hypothetical protein
MPEYGKGFSAFPLAAACFWGKSGLSLFPNKA